MSYPAPHLRYNQAGVPPGWLRIDSDQIEHKSKRVCIRKVVFLAGGKYYRSWFKDKRDNWCSVPDTHDTLAEAIEQCERLAVTKELP